MSNKKIKAEVIFTPFEVEELLLRDKNVVVIDVLRSSTTIAVALNNGAKEIIPVASIEGAVKISGSLFGDVTLRGGERNGKMIEGFNLGNSPHEYDEETVKGKSIIFCTTNGTSAITKGKYAKNLVIAGFVNSTVAAEYIAGMNEDFYIICSGKHNKFCIEDAVCAGLIINKVEESNQNIIKNDAAEAALCLYRHHSKSILKMLQKSEHGKFLIELGFKEDLKICGDVDSVPVLPLQSNNIIILKKDVDAPKKKIKI